MKPEVDVVRHESLWFEPTAGGLSPLLERRAYEGVDLPETFPSGM
jgi:hypothetical protein